MTGREYEATSAFTFVDRKSKPIAFSGGSLVLARWCKVLAGNINGRSELHLLQLQQKNGPATYVGLERYDVDIHGRRGTFLLMHSAIIDGEDHETSWTIVSGSGTGDLVGLSGRAEITRTTLSLCSTPFPTEPESAAARQRAPISSSMR